MKLTAVIKSTPKITANVKPPKKITAKFGNLMITSGTSSFYDGDYTVKPKADKKTVLPTKEKVMRDNITVLEIPYFEVSNEFGSTVYIGGESEVI